MPSNTNPKQNFTLSRNNILLKDLPFQRRGREEFMRGI